MSTFGIVYVTSPLNCVRNPLATWQYGFSCAISGSCARIAQLSVTVWPVLVPPWTVRPLLGRAVRLISTPSQWEYWSPNLSAAVTKLFVCPNCAGLTS